MVLQYLYLQVDWLIITMQDRIPDKLERIEKKLDKLEEKLDDHIKEIWTVYKPIKELLKRLEKFKLW